MVYIVMAGLVRTGWSGLFRRTAPAFAGPAFWLSDGTLSSRLAAAKNRNGGDSLGPVVDG